MPHDHEHDPRLDFSGRPDDVDPSSGSAAPQDSTFRLSDLGFGTRGSAGTGVGTGTDEPDGATVLDPASWSSEVPHQVPQQVPQQASHQAAPPAATFAGGLHRFGPGVPGGPDTSAGTVRTAAVWHGTVRPGEPVLPPERRRGKRALGGWLLALVVLLGVLAYLLWQHFPGSVKVDGVTVRNATAVQGCHSTAKVVGTLRTSGDAGTVRYRWRRSDGTLSDELKQRVAKGSRSTDVVLLWSFDGRGSLTATATLEVLGPQRQSASTTFTYRCA